MSLARYRATIRRQLARLSPRSSPPESIRTVEPFVDGDPRQLAAAADGMGIVVGICIGVAAIVTLRPSLLVVAAGAGYGTAVLVRGAIAAVGNARRSRTLGTAPTVVNRAVLRMRITPAIEEAADFAAETDGRLGDQLTEYVGRVA